MRRRAISYIGGALALAALIWRGSATDARTQGLAVVSGVIVDPHGPVAGAVVRQQTTTNQTESSDDGSFTLRGLTEGITATITAWSAGYHPGGVEVAPPQLGVTITLTLHPTGDNPEHAWLTSMPVPEDPIGCGHCMVAFPQWESNAHAGSATNRRFLSLYNGTDLTGTAAVGPGYKVDFPETAGSCATCHAPGAAADAQFTADMNDLEGVEREGIFCDLCHKIGSAYLNPATEMPYNNAPGVASYRLYRPPAGTHMFFGPFDDVTRRVSYLELEKRSQFCAPCHQFSFWGTPIYESYGEWLESPYPSQGIECQTCHMKPTGVDYFVYPDKGGLIRDPALIASHLQPGASDVALLQETVSMTLAVEPVRGLLRATVTITNTGAGHHVPTDFPGRHMILVVRAIDHQGRDLTQAGGPQVPEWGGPQSGLPGTAYAKVLRDVQTGEAPVVTYWRQALIISDNRIPALGSHTSVYTFTAPARGRPATIDAELLFRRTFYNLMGAKGWDTPDIVMATVSRNAMPRIPPRLPSMDYASPARALCFND